MLDKRKEDEIKKIKKVLKENKISQNAVESHLSVLASVKLNKIKDLFKLLHNNGVTNEIIDDFFGLLIYSKKLEDAFSVGNQNLLIYLKLTGCYNKTVTLYEIIKICEKKQITVRQFVEAIFPPTVVDNILSTVYKRKIIYIGISKKMDDEFFNNNLQLIDKIAQSVAKKFVRTYKMILGNDFNEYKQQALIYLYEKCGDLAFNYADDLEIFRKTAFAKTYKYLLINLKERSYLELDSISYKVSQPVEKSSMKGESLDFDGWGDNLQDNFKEFLNNLSFYISSGYTMEEIMINSSTFLGIETDEFIEKLNNAKSQIIEGGYEMI